MRDVPGTMRTGDCLHPTPVNCVDHEYETVDDSFDHEYGTEVIVYVRCIHCGDCQAYEPADYDWDDSYM